jgi:putative transposase
MQLVEQHHIDGYDTRWRAIDVAVFASKNLYNAALYLTRQTYIKNHTILNYGDLDKLLQPTGEYRALPFKVAQQSSAMGAAAGDARLEGLFRRVRRLGG